MPRYVKGRNKKLQRCSGFENAHHMSKWLTRTNRNDTIWKTHFSEKAKTYKNHNKRPFLHARSLRAVAQKTPVKLAGDVLRELRQARKGKAVGGGISETIHWFAAEAANVMGINSFKEYVGLGYQHREIPDEAQRFAFAVQETYKDKDKRAHKIHGLQRVPKYDNDRYSVWKQPNGQLLVTIHGTKMGARDLFSDSKIAMGRTVSDAAVEKLFQEFDATGVEYDVAAHSLSTQFVVNAEHKRADKIYLFNAASSPLQSSEYLNKSANDEQYTYFINPSDGVSEALWQKMDEDTVNRSYVSPYMWSPAAAHSLGQWHPDYKESEDELEDTEVQQQGIKRI